MTQKDSKTTEYVRNMEGKIQITQPQDDQKPQEPHNSWLLRNGKDNVYISVAILSKNIFIDRILTCSVQYIR